MYPILARTELGFVFTFTVVWLLGVALAFWLVWRDARRLNVSIWRLVDLFLLCGAAALVGGRVAFVGLNWDYFGANSAEIINLSRGGYAYLGALPAALLAYRRFAKTTPISAAALVVLALAGWAACYADGCAYGRVATEAGPLVSALPDNYGVITLRYGTQMGGILLSALVGLVAWGLRRSAHVATITLVLLCAAHFFIAFFRGDTMPMLFGLRADALTSLAVMATSPLWLYRSKT